MKWFSLSRPCNKLTLCFRTNYAKAEPLEGGTASLFQLCVASVSLSVPVCEIWLLQLLFIKKLNVLPFLWDRLKKKKKDPSSRDPVTHSVHVASFYLSAFLFFSSEKPILSTSHLLRQLLECSVYLCVNTCFLVQSALSSALYKNSLSYLQITLWRNCQFGKREYGEAERLDCWAGTDRSAFFFSSLLSFSVLLPLYMSVLVITKPTDVFVSPGLWHRNGFWSFQTFLPVFPRPLMSFFPQKRKLFIADLFIEKALPEKLAWFWFILCALVFLKQIHFHFHSFRKTVQCWYLIQDQFTIVFVSLFACCVFQTCVSSHLSMCSEPSLIPVT